MKLIDESFAGNKFGYIVQCLLAGLSTVLVLALLTSISNIAVIASLGASSFIVFALPHTVSSRPRFLVGGYVVGVAVGSGFLWLRYTTSLPQEFGFIPFFPHVVFGGAAVAMATFVMVVTNTEHPPAAGLALGFVMLDEWRWITPIAVLVGIVALCLIKTLLKPILRNLL